MRFDELEKRVEKGYLRKVISPCGRLVLFNYTDKAVFDRAWDEYTLFSRGTVYEIETGNLVATPFEKFFNYGELDLDLQQKLLTETGFDVYEKADGSLGIIYFYDGEWRVNTRGSFTSDQAVKGKEILAKYDLSGIPRDITLLAEIIYPENRIIVDYGDQEKLVLLGAYQEGTDLNAEIYDLGRNLKMEVAKKMKFSTVDSLIEARENLPAQEEGFVVRFKDGLRVKFKGVEYLRIARILSRCSPLAFWETMKKGQVDKQVLQEIPEEFRDEQEKIVDKLEKVYSETVMEIYSTIKIVREATGVKDGEKLTNDDRRNVGLFLKSNEVQHSSVVFPFLLRNIDAVEKYVMKIIRPTGNLL